MRHPWACMRVDVSLCGSMKQLILTAFIALLSFLPARAQLDFSDSIRFSLLTCSAGPQAYEHFGHTAIRVQDLRTPQLDVVFHYGVFSFNAPFFIYRFVKGETDYQLGAEWTSGFVGRYQRDGMGIVEQRLRLDSAQCQEMKERLLINYRPENRVYRYSFFFDNCATRPYHLLNKSVENTIQYDSTWVNAKTFRQMVQEKTGTNNWLDFGIALAVALPSERLATFEEQLFLPSYLYGTIEHAQIPVKIGENSWYEPLVSETDTLLTMLPEVEAAIAAPDPISPTNVCTALLLLALLITAFEWKQQSSSNGSTWALKLANSFDCLFFLVLGLTGIIVWFLNFFSEHPAVDHNLNCFWLLPFHVIVAVLLWFKKCQRFCRIYFGITFALVIVYVVLDWILGQYCPTSFLLLLATLLLRSYMRMTVYSQQNDQ